MKRLIFAILVLFTFTSGMLYLYIFLQPKNPTIYEEVYKDQIKISENQEDTIISIEQTVNTNLSTGSNYLFFYSSKGDNSQYLILNVINPLAQSINLKEFTFLKKIDVVNLIAKDEDLESLKTLYGIDKIPAFVKIEKTYTGDVEVSDVLSYNESNPFNEEDVKNWMIATGSWPIVDEVSTAKPILKPE